MATARALSLLSGIITGASYGLALACLITFAAYAAEPKRVLVLQSFGRDYAPFGAIDAGFRQSLIEGAHKSVDLYDASIFKARFERADETGLVAYIQDLFSKRRPDVVVAFGFPAADFAEKHHQQLFGTTPVVIGLIRRRIPASWFNQHTVAVPMTFNIRHYIENILQLLPDTKTIAVTMGSTPLEQYWRAQAEASFRGFSNRVTFVWLTNLTLNELKLRVARLPTHSVVLETTMLVDAAGVPHPGLSGYHAIKDAANAPVFAYADNKFGRGTVGGRLNQWNALGAKMAEATLRIFNGEKPNEIKVAPIVPSPPTYDWRELHKWNINKSLLPPGSVVRFREPTIWERYWREISTALGLIAIQALLISGLLHERRRRAIAEIEVRHRMSELAAMNRRAIAGQLSASIAHEINQPLTAIASSGSAALRWISLKTPNVDEAKSSLQRIINDSHRAAKIVGSVRTLFKKDDQTRTKVDVNRIIDNVLDLLRAEIEMHGATVKVVKSQALPYVHADRVQLQQVVLNLIRNALDSMDAVADRRRVLNIRTECDGSRKVIVSVADTGKGLESQDVEKIFAPFFTTKPQGMGMGLSICRSIVEAHGGHLSARPASSRGAIFEIELPQNSDRSVL